MFIGFKGISQWVRRLSMFVLVSLPLAVQGVEIQTITLKNERLTQLGTFMAVLEDSNRNLSPFSIVQPEWQEAWNINSRHLLNLGYSDHAYWIQFKLDASASIYKQWHLVIGNAILDYVDIYQVFPEEGPRLIYRSGMKRAFNNRAEDHRFFIVPLELYHDPENPVTLLMQVQSGGSLYLPIELHPDNQFWASLQVTDVFNWMFYGIILAMSLYNLFLFLAVRDVSYLYYVLFVVSFASAHLSMDGYVFQHLWPDDIPYSPVIDTICYLASAAFGVLFITHFLNLKEHLPLVHRLSVVAGLMMFPAIALVIYYHEVSVDHWVTPLLGLLLIYALSLGFYGLIKQVPMGRNFVVAWIVFAFGNLYLIAAYSGFNFGSLITPLAVSKISSFWEAMLLSFALAGRIRRVTDEREAQRMRAESQSYFLAQVSHEIRTPLNGVLGSLNLLEQTSLNKEQQNYVDIIQSSGRSLLSLVNDVLDYSKIASGKQDVELSDFNIWQLTEHLMNLFRSEATQKSINLELEIASNVPQYIHSDRQRLHQIWSNLIANAIKFTDAGQVTVRLSFSSDGSDLLTLSVIDTGIGIPKPELERLFEAYHQVQVSKRRVYGGTGLGLAITKELLELMGGQIEVTSVEGEGSEFKTLIPVQIAQSSVSKARSDLPEFNQQLNVLVAEDNEVNQQVIRGLLKKWGHQVTLVNHGGEAIKARKDLQLDFDLILMDCEMPEVDGYCATETIRDYEKQHALKAIPIVALTAYALEDVKERCLKSGMNAFLTKPISRKQLNRTLAEMFSGN